MVEQALVIVIPPPGLVDKFAREHPKEAFMFLLFGLGMLGFAIWLIISDWLHS